MELKPVNDGDWTRVLAEPDPHGIIIAHIPDYGRFIVDNIDISSEEGGVIVEEDPDQANGGMYRICRGVGRVSIADAPYKDPVVYEITEFQEYIKPFHTLSRA